ncbi:MAG: hypothetical protein CME62_08190 [Halobacteriovoraceae bacterium]|nr:hypothetical protein [Halobacteriovoraceae bacterium]
MVKYLFLFIFLIATVSCFDQSKEDEAASLFANHKIGNEEFQIYLPPKKTYKENDQLNFILESSTKVLISGTPRIELTVGGTTVYADYKSGSGTQNVVFTYTVQSGHNDEDGIEINSNIDLNAGQVQIFMGGSWKDAQLDVGTFNAQDIYIDTTIPSITNIIPPSPKTYYLGQGLVFSIEFSESIIVTGSPKLEVNIDGEIQTVQYLSGSGGKLLSFKKIIGENDQDLDGLNLVTSIDSTGSTIKDSAGNNADLNFSISAALQTVLDNVFIDGLSPYVNKVENIQSRTYYFQEIISFDLAFTEKVVVEEIPIIKVDMGGQEVDFAYDSGSGSDTLTFSYEVNIDDFDTNGVEIDNQIDLNSGSIKSLTGENAVLSFTAPLTPNLQVDARQPKVVSIITNPDGTYTNGQQLNFVLNYNIPVDFVDDVPRLPLIIGSNTVYASYLNGNGTKNFSFSYNVTASDYDGDGIVIGNNLDHQLATATSSTNIPASSDLTTALLTTDTTGVLVGSLNPPTQLVITNQPTDTYKDALISPAITVEVRDGSNNLVTTSSAMVTLSFNNDPSAGSASLGGSVAKAAVNGVATFDDISIDTVNTGYSFNFNSSGLTAATSSQFDILDNTPTVTIDALSIINLSNYTSYTVTGTCSEDGRTVTLDIGGVAATPTCSSNTFTTGAIDVSAAADNAALVVTADHDNAIGMNATQASSTVLKDTIAPSISTNTINAQTYNLNDDLTYAITFDENVTVSGAPRVQLNFNAQSTANIYADYDNGSTTATLYFIYTIAAGDADSDGITTTSPLDLNSGTITDAAGNAADLTFIPNDFSSILVDSDVPSIVEFIEPVNGTYPENVEILFQVNFNELVNVTNFPRIILDVDGNTRYATYQSGSGSTGLEFAYTVQAGESDLDGITVTSTSIDLNGGTIKAADTADAVLDFTLYLDDLSGVIVDANTGITPPDQVTGLTTAPTTSNTTLALSWSVPNDNGTALTHYVVQYREQGESTWINHSPNPTVNSTEIAGLSSGVTYEFRVAANNGLLGPFSSTATAEIFDLTDLNLALWLDFSDSTTLFTDSGCTTNVSSDGETVGCITDKAGFGRDFIQTDVGKRPFYRTATVNGLDGLEFMGDGDFLEDDDGELYVNGFQAFEFFIVIKSDVTNTDKGFLHTKNPSGADDTIALRYDQSGASGGCNNCLKGGVQRADSTHIQSESQSSEQTTNTQVVGATWADGGAFNIYVNGSLSQSHSSGTMTGSIGGAQTFILGKGPKDTGTGNSWDGEILEVIFLNTQTSGADRTKLINYLNSKWGI